MATVFGQTRKKRSQSRCDKRPQTRASDRRKPALPIRASRAVIRRVLSERAAVLIANAPQDLAGAASIMGARIQSIIGVPLWDGDEIRGVIQCDNRSSAAMFRNAISKCCSCWLVKRRWRSKMRDFISVCGSPKNSLAENRYLKAARKKASHRRADRPKSRLPRGVKASSESHGHPRHRLHRRRNWHRQRACRFADSWAVEPPRQAVRRPKLRRRS